MYGGDVQAGVSNLLVTGLAGLGTWYAYQDPNSRWLFTGLAGVGTLTLYIRQIGNAIQAAESFNQEQRQEWRDELMWAHPVTVELQDEDGTLEIRVGLEQPESEVQ